MQSVIAGIKYPLRIVFASIILLTGFFAVPLLTGADVNMTLPVTSLVSGPMLAKTAGGATVYFLSYNNLRIAIPSAKVFLSYKYSWQQVQTVDQQKLDSYQDAEYFSLLNNAAIYLVSGGTKRYITQAAAAALNIDPAQVVEINKTHFNSFATGANLDVAEAQSMAAAASAAAQNQIGQTRAGGGSSNSLAGGSGGDASNSFVSGSVNGTDTTASVCQSDPSTGGADGCLIYQAMVSNDVNICDSVSVQKWKAICYEAFTPSGTDPLAYCKKLTDNTELANCIEHEAVKQNNIKLCDQINALLTGANRNLICQSNVYIAEKNPAACNVFNIFDTANRDTCNFTYASINNQLSFCENIRSDSMRPNCRVVLAKMQAAAASQN